jgi:hypothetical protein
MFPLTSNRLRLIPLTIDQLHLLTQSRAALEAALGLAVSDMDFDGGSGFMEEFRAVIPSYVIPAVAAHPDHFAWYTHWLVVHGALNLTIGGLGVTGLPDAEGQLMLGYFIDKKFENAGFTTEAVACLLDWVFLQPGGPVGSRRHPGGGAGVATGPAQERLRARRPHG